MPKIDMPNVPFGLDELPMDKMAETAENLKERLNSFKLLEELEIKSAVDGLKHQASHQMKQLIANSQEQIREIQNVLKDKVGEIESLKKNVDAIAIERDQYKKQVLPPLGGQHNFLLRFRIFQYFFKLLSSPSVLSPL